MKYLATILMLLPLFSLSQANLYTKAEITLVKGELNILGNWFHGDSLQPVLIYNARKIDLHGNLINASPTRIFGTDTMGTVSFAYGHFYILGDSSALFYNLQVKDQANIMLDQSIDVDGTIQLDSGSIQLNGSDIRLGQHGSLYNEHENGYVFGDSGSIILHNPLWVAPSFSNNIRGTGLYVQAGAVNFGAATIYRTHARITNVADTSINRAYYISTNQPGTATTIKLKFLPTIEAQHIDPVKAAIYISQDSGFTWRKHPTLLDTIHSEALTTNVNLHHSLVTIASSECSIKPSLNMPDSIFICENDSAHIGTSTLQGIEWSTGNQTDSVYIKNPGQYWVTVFDSAGCENTDTFMVIVDSIPKVQFSTLNHCSNDSVQFINQTQYAGGNVIYTWDFGDTTTSADTSHRVGPAHKYLPGTYIVQLKAATSHHCTDSTSKPITVFSSPTAHFSMQGMCENTPVSFLDSSHIQSGGIAGRKWFFGDGDSSAVQNPIHTYTDSIAYIVKLVIQSNTGCTDSSMQIFKPKPLPFLMFTMQGHCATDTLDIHYIGDSLSNYSWDFGDGLTGVNYHPHHAYSTAGQYTIQLTGTGLNGCTDTLHTPVQIDSVPSSPWNGAPLGTCTGSMILDAGNPGATYNWSTTATTRTLPVSTNGLYTVYIKYNNGCSVSDSTFVTLNNNLTPQLGNDTSVCGQILLDAGYPGSTYTWSDGYTKQKRVVAATGKYWVSVQDANNCTGTDTIVVVIHPNPHNYLGNDTVVCNSNGLWINGGHWNSIRWSTGDTVANIYVSGSGAYHCLVTDSLGCVGADTILVQIPSPMKGRFSYITEMCGHDTIWLNAASGAAQSSWYRNGKIVSNSPSLPVVTPGNYKLHMISPLGCTYIDSTLVLESGYGVHADFLVTTSTKVNDTLQFVNVSHSKHRPIRYTWNFDDGTGSTSTHPTHTYFLPGAFNAKLTASNQWCVDSAIKQILINAYKRDTVFSSQSAEIIRLSKINKASLYPNPNQGQFHLVVQLSDKIPSEVFIVDLNGNILWNNYFMYQEYDEIINIGEHVSSMYLLVVKINGDMRVLKFVVD